MCLADRAGRIYLTLQPIWEQPQAPGRLLPDRQSISVLGRGLKHALPPDLWSALERTFAGPGIEENWEALFTITALFRRVAPEVGQALGYAYPQELDRGVSAYLEETRHLPHPQDRTPW